jgi:hypothetical protein
MFRKLAVLSIFVGTAIAPTAALADPYYFNDGAGTCGWIDCGPNGCAILISYPCPREVGGD